MWSLSCSIFSFLYSAVPFLLAIILSALWFTASDYSFGIFWPLYCLPFDLQLLITPLVSSGHYIVCPLIYSFWLLLWYLLAIILSALWFTASDYSFGIFWPLYCLPFDLQLLITLWYLLAIILSVLWFTASDYPLISSGHYIVCPLIYSFWLPFDIFWPLYCLSFDLQLLITSLISSGHYIVCPLIYSFWLPLWYLLAIILSVLWFTASDYPFGIFWPLYCLSFDLQLLITPLVSFGHYIIWPLIYSFWLLLWYLLAIILSDLWFTASDYSFGIFWPLYCLAFDLRLLITLWYLLAIILSVLWFTASDYLFDIFWPLYCLSFDLQLLITPLVSSGHYIVCPLIYSFWLPLWYLLAIILSVLWFTASDYLFDIFWPLYCLSFDLRLLITSLISFGHYIYLSFDLQLLITSLISSGHYIVCPLIYSFWLPLWYLLAIILSVLWFTASDYLFDIFWPLYYLSFDLQLLITSLISSGHYIVWPLIYSFWLPFGIFWPLYCLTFDLQRLITPLVSSGHYIVCPLIYSFWLLLSGHYIVCPLIYSFWLPLWYLLAIILSDLWFTASDYPFGIFWPLYCLTFDLQLLITLWYLLAILLSDLWFTASDYPFGIFWALHCLSFNLDSDYPFGIFWPFYCLSFDLQLLITPLVSSGHYSVCPLIYSFWLPLWYLLTIILSVLRFTASDYPFGIFWPLYCLYFNLQLLITPLVSSGHYIVCPLIYSFWLPLWYLLAIILSVL